jgi:phosphohistidine phosphatase SixA
MLPETADSEFLIITRSRLACFFGFDSGGWVCGFFCGSKVRRRDEWATGIFLSALLLFLSGCMASSVADRAESDVAARYVFVVRHAERYFDSQEDPPLTPEGEARAQALAATLRDAGVTAIITTQWRRTRDTAKPLASLLRIAPEVIPVHEGKALENVREVAAAVRRHRDETVLVVGHITVTGVIAALGGPRLPTICENVFSDLFVFTPAAGDDGLLHLRYGAAEDISARCR